jgi:adenosine deaminase
MTQICEAGIVREICPTSNLALEDEEALRETFRAFNEHNVQFTIATDGPEMMRTHLRDEFELLLRISALDESQVSEANRRGQDASFLPGESVVQRA